MNMERHKRVILILATGMIVSLVLAAYALVSTVINGSFPATVITEMDMRIEVAGTNYSSSFIAPVTIRGPSWQNTTQMTIYNVGSLNFTVSMVKTSVPTSYDVIWDGEGNLVLVGNKIVRNVTVLVTNPNSVSNATCTVSFNANQPM